ncbi:CHAT domain-containing protein [Actinomadura sp. 1N219]|uniref:CHAT domain-containing protein n=1 Tax=Actinomadura sp. 1N219 TaxID=3375152 RepID=UPI0037A5CCB9
MGRRIDLLLVGAAVRAAERLWAEWDEISALPEDERRSVVAEVRSGLADDDVLESAADLRSRHLRAGRRGGRGDLDVRVAARIAQLIWYRYRFLPERAPAEELVFAFSLFRRVHAHDPSAVPAMISPLFSADPATADGRYEDDLHTLIAAAGDLIGHGGDEHRRHAAALAHGAVDLALRTRGVGPALRAELTGLLFDAHVGRPRDDLLGLALPCARAAVLLAPAHAGHLVRRIGALAVAAGTSAPGGQDRLRLGEALERLASAARVLPQPSPSHSGDEGASLRRSLGALASVIHRRPRTDPSLSLSAKILTYGVVIGWSRSPAVTYRSVVEASRVLDLIGADDPDRDRTVMDALLAGAFHVLSPDDAGPPGEVRRAIEERLGRGFPPAAGLDPAFDLEVAKELAGLCWDRYTSAPDDVPEDRTAFAISLFGHLHAIDPGLVPSVLVPSYDRDAPETARDQADLSLLSSCARDLLASAADLPAGRTGAEIRRHAVILIERARALGRRLGPVDPAVQAMLVSALAKLLDDTLDAALLDEIDELAASFELTALRSLTGDGTADSIERLREDLVRRPYAQRHGRGRARESDLRLIIVLAAVYFARYRFRAGEGGFQLELALAVYGRLHTVDPGLVPFSLRRVFDPRYERPDDFTDQDVEASIAWADDLFTYAQSLAGTPGAQDELRGRCLRHAAALLGQAREHADRLADLTPSTRAELALSMVNWHEHLSGEPVLDRAVADARRALAETADDEERLDRLGVLGFALAQVAETRGDPDALREAIGLLRPAISAAGPEHPHIVRAALGLLRVLTQRGAWNTGLAATAETAVELRPLLDLVPEDHPGRKLLLLPVLVAELSHLFQIGDYSGARERLRAVDLAVRDLPEDEPLRDLYRLILASHVVLERMLAQEPGLEEALADYRETFDRVGRTMDPRDRAAQLDTMITVLLEADSTMGLPGVADGCAAMLTEAMDGIADDTEEYQALKAQLGTVLTARFPASGERDDLERGIGMLRERLTGLRNRRAEISDPTSRFLVASSLGEALAKQHRLTGDERSYREAMSLLEANARDPDHLVIGRLSDTWKAGRIAAEAGRWNDALGVLADGIALSAELAWRGLDRPDQEQALGLWSGTVNEAAAAAIRAGDPGRAVELLEQGRAVLIHRTLDVRGDAARLRAAHPGLADRLEAVGREIDATRDRDRRHALGRAWDGLVAEIRARPGFGGFLRPQGFSSLRPADGQTVVIVNAAEFGSDALLVTGAGVRVVELPGLTVEETRERVTAFLDALDQRTRPTGPAGPAARAAADATIGDVLDWLWRTTARPVLDALGHTRPPAPGRPWPHLHWCPTWLLTFLPFHAAAAADPSGDGDGDSVLDRVISSYAVSLRTLRSGTEQGDPPPSRRSLLVISMPGTPDLPSLPGALRESSLLSGLPVPTRTLTGDQADRAAVRRALDEHAWAHFACHAAQDLRHPSRGRLFLHDHRTRPFTVLDISRMHLRHARFAFLSACETARGGRRLPDEALHLGGALQLAGYQHVIATLWPVKDAVAAEVTADVYARLHTSEGSIDTARAAAAVHEAMRTQRDRHPDDPALWAGYVHFGP